jgi:hypothetical protein
MAERAMVEGIVGVGAGDEVTGRQLRRVRRALAAAGGALVVGALLPWARVSAPHGHSFTLNSLERGNDGWLVLAVGFVVLALALMHPARLSALAATAAGLLASSVVLHDWGAMRRLVAHAEDVQPAPVHAAIGLGLWLSVVAAVGVVALSVAWCTVEYARRRPAGHLPLA